LISVDWLDRPVQAGDPFVPLGPCRVETPNSVWLIDPDPMGGGRYVAIPQSMAPSGLDWALARGEWSEYDCIRWGTDGNEYRLEFGRRGQGPRDIGTVALHIRRVEGEWSLEEPGD
jgi:hypothetical protein